MFGINNVKIFDSNSRYTNTPSEIGDLLDNYVPIVKKIWDAESNEMITLCETEVVGYIENFTHNNGNKYYGDIVIFPTHKDIKGILVNKIVSGEPVTTNSELSEEMFTIDRICCIEME